MKTRSTREKFPKFKHLTKVYMFYFSAPDNYTLTQMLGKTVTSGHKQAPIYSMKARSTIGSFHEDLAKVQYILLKQKLLIVFCI